MIVAPVSIGSGTSSAEGKPMTEAALSESPGHAHYGADGQPRRRAFALAILLHIIVGTILLLLQKNEQFVKMGEQDLKTFNIAPNAPKGSETDKTQQKEEKKTPAKRAASQEQPVAVQTPPPPPLPPPVVPNDLQKPAFIELSSADYAASNIGKQASQRVAGPAVGQQDSKAPYGPGSGPGGSTLYPADWFREPTSTELDGYLKPDMPREGRGEIACKTVAQHHVEDCYIIGESPRGSGYGRAVLNAAWQFLVMPPRINGKEEIGTWVRITITYYDGSLKGVH